MIVDNIITVYGDMTRSKDFSDFKGILDKQYGSFKQFYRALQVSDTSSIVEIECSKYDDEQLDIVITYNDEVNADYQLGKIIDNLSNKFFDKGGHASRKCKGNIGTLILSI